MGKAIQIANKQKSWQQKVLQTSELMTENAKFEIFLTN
jgi:hypothetical protein